MQDPILGFFHVWIQEFSLHVDSVTVLAQQTGAYSFSDNVTVHSLGKEMGASKFSQVRTFWRHCIQDAAQYDCVFVHMTPIWILLGAPLWIVLRKPMYLWYEIKRGSWKLSAALLFVRKVFAASEHGLPSVSKKQVTVGHGISIGTFTENPALREAHHLVAVGRITPVKQYELIVRALSKMPDCTLTIAGGTVTEADKQTEHEIKELIYRLNIADRVEIGWVSPQDMPSLLQGADCMVHASKGGLDKVVLQAMSCGCPVVSASEAAHSVLPEECCATTENISQKIEAVLALSSDKRQSLSKKLRTIVQENHSLSQCISRIVSHM